MQHTTPFSDRVHCRPQHTRKQAHTRTYHATTRLVHLAERIKKLKGLKCHAFTVRIRTENQNQASSPFGQHKTSVLSLSKGNCIPPSRMSLPSLYSFPRDCVFHIHHHPEKRLDANPCGLHATHCDGIAKTTLTAMMLHDRLNSELC